MTRISGESRNDTGESYQRRVSNTSAQQTNAAPAQVNTPAPATNTAPAASQSSPQETAQERENNRKAGDVQRHMALFRLDKEERQEVRQEIRERREERREARAEAAGETASAGGTADTTSATDATGDKADKASGKNDNRFGRGTFAAADKIRNGTYKGTFDEGTNVRSIAAREEIKQALENGEIDEELYNDIKKQIDIYDITANIDPDDKAAKDKIKYLNSNDKNAIDKIRSHPDAVAQDLLKPMNNFRQGMPFENVEKILFDQLEKAEERDEPATKEEIEAGEAQYQQQLTEARGKQYQPFREEAEKNMWLSSVQNLQWERGHQDVSIEDVRAQKLRPGQVDGVTGRAYQEIDALKAAGVISEQDLRDFENIIREMTSDRKGSTFDALGTATRLVEKYDFLGGLYGENSPVGNINHYLTKAMQERPVGWKLSNLNIAAGGSGR